MMDRRTFMRWMGLAPVAAVAAVALPKMVKLARPGENWEQFYGWGDVTQTGRWSAVESAEYGRHLEMGRKVERMADKTVKWEWK